MPAQRAGRRTDRRLERKTGVICQVSPLQGSVMADRGGATRLSGRCRSLLDSKRRQRRPQAYWERFSADC